MKLASSFQSSLWWAKLERRLTEPFSRSLNRRIVTTAAAIAAVTILVKGAALAKEAIVAWRFGTRDDLDAFTVAQTIPFFLISIAGTSFQTAFIPTYVQVQQQEGAQAAQELFSSSLLGVLGLLLLLIVVTLLAGPVYLPYLAQGFAPEKTRLTYQLLWLIAPTVCFVGINGLWSAVLNVKNVFAGVAALPLVTTSLMILFLLVAQGWGVYTMAVTLTLGAATELLLLGVLLHRQGLSLRCKWYGLTPALKQVARLSASLTVSNLLAAGSSLVNVAIAASLVAGSVASLGYANKLLALPIGLIATALGTVLLPHFARLTAERDWQQIKHTLKRFLQFSLALTVPITIALLLFAEPLTRLLLQRGAFGSTDVIVVAGLFFYLAWQFPFYVASSLVSRLLESLQANRLLLLVTGVDFVVNAFSAWFLSRKMQVAGVALAITITRSVSFATLFFLTYRLLKKA